MAQNKVSIANLLYVRQTLIDDIQRRLQGPIAEFLRSIQSNGPNFETLGYPKAAELPAVRWKLQSLQKLQPPSTRVLRQVHRFDHCTLGQVPIHLQG